MRSLKAAQRSAVLDAAKAALNENTHFTDSERLMLQTNAELVQTVMDGLVSLMVTGKLIGDELQAICPFHADRSMGNFSLNITSGYYKCWACGARGGLHSLARHFKINSQLIDLLHRVDFKLLREYLSKSKHVEPGPVSKIIPDKILLKFPHISYRYLNRGHSKELLESLGVRYDPTHDRTVFPVRNISGDIIALQGRAESKSQLRWKFYRSELTALLSKRDLEEYSLEDYKPPRRSMFYNEQNSLVSLIYGKLARPVVIVEGPGHALRVLAAGYPVLGTFGATLTVTQLTRLKSSFPTGRRELIFASDGDHAGAMSAVKASLFLGPKFICRVADLKPNTDPEDYTPKALRNLLRDASNIIDVLTEDTALGERVRTAYFESVENIQY